jgi:hypothetical protein
MSTIRAHFDGKVIVPDEPIDLPVDQELIVTVSTASVSKDASTDYRDWIGLGNQGRPTRDPRFKSDGDLWKKDQE